MKQFLFLFGFLIVFTATLSLPRVSRAVEMEVISEAPFSEEQRLRGFHLYQKDQRDFDKERLSGIDEFKNQQKKWDASVLRTIPSYKLEKAKEAAPLDEKSAAYKADRQKRYEAFQLQESNRKRYVAFRDAAAKKKTANIKLTEEEEYALNVPYERVDPSKRALYFAKGKSGSTSSGGSSGSGFSGGGGGNYEPPPPPPPMPPTDYYEPEIPPPPPPLDGFDDSIPPPIFDEPPPEF